MNRFNALGPEIHTLKLFFDLVCNNKSFCWVVVDLNKKFKLLKVNELKKLEINKNSLRTFE